MKDFEGTEWVEIEVCNSRTSAEIIASLLKGNDIEVSITSDDVSGLYPQLSLMHGVKVWVKEDDEVLARKILSDYQSHPPEES